MGRGLVRGRETEGQIMKSKLNGVVEKKILVVDRMKYESKET